MPPLPFHCQPPPGVEIHPNRVYLKFFRAGLSGSVPLALRNSAMQGSADGVRRSITELRRSEAGIVDRDLVRASDRRDQVGGTTASKGFHFATRELLPLYPTVVQRSGS